MASQATGSVIGAGDLMPLHVVSEKWYQEVVIPYNHNYMTTVGIDLTLGGTAWTVSHDGRSRRKLSPGDTLSLYPGESALVETRETLRLPVNCMGFVFPKLSLVQEQGVVQAPPVVVDYGYGRSQKDGLPLRVAFRNESGTVQQLEYEQPICRLVLLATPNAPARQFEFSHIGTLSQAGLPVIKASPTLEDVEAVKAQMSPQLNSMYRALAETVAHLKAADQDLNERLERRLGELSQDRATRWALILGAVSIFVTAILVMVVFVAEALGRSGGS